MDELSPTLLHPAARGCAPGCYASTGLWVGSVRVQHKAQEAVEPVRHNLMLVLDDN
jgi:hypothetical protein